MNPKILFALFLILVASLVGCGPKEPQIYVPATQHYDHAEQLPKQAEIVEDLGNGWIVYKVLVLGEIRWFKARYQADTVGDGQYALQAITELRPPASYYGYPK